LRRTSARRGLFHRTTLGITDGGTTDNYQISFHGQTVAHVDSWCHFFENGQMYAACRAENLNPEKDASRAAS
jgi:hypothetical protein